MEGGHLLSLGVALKRAFVNGSELPVCSIRSFLFADVLADLLQFEADRRDSLTAGPQMFAREIPLLPAQPGNGDCTLPLQKSDHGSDRVLGGNGDAHMHMVWHEVSFDNLTLLLPGQRMENRPQMLTRLPENYFAPSLGHENDMVLAVLFRMG